MFGRWRSIRPRMPLPEALAAEYFEAHSQRNGSCLTISDYGEQSPHVSLSRGRRSVCSRRPIFYQTTLAILQHGRLPFMRPVLRRTPIFWKLLDSTPAIHSMTTSTSPNSINKTVFRSLLLALTLVSLVVLTHSATAQERNQGSQIIQEFQVGHNPVGLLFDGTSIWVANQGDGTVSKLHTDGTTEGVFPVGAYPYSLIFDGSNIWVTNQFSSTVTKVRASDGILEGNYPAGDYPSGITFDGDSIWVTNVFSGCVTKLRASDGSKEGTFTDGIGIEPHDVVTDGSNVWVSNYVEHTVTKLRASDGALMGVYRVGLGPQGLVFDGVNIWVANYVGGTVTALRASDGVRQGTFQLERGPFGLVFDGTTIWATNVGNDSLVRLWPGLGIKRLKMATHPTGLAFDGNSIWVTNNYSNVVSKISRRLMIAPPVAR